MEQKNDLRGEILKRFKSVSAFGRELGWTRQKAHRIVEHKTEPSLLDIEKMSKAMDVSLTRMAEFFLH